MYPGDFTLEADQISQALNSQRTSLHLQRRKVNPVGTSLAIHG